MEHEIWFERAKILLVLLNLEEFLKKIYTKFRRIYLQKGSNNRGVWLKWGSDQWGSAVLFSSPLIVRFLIRVKADSHLAGHRIRIRHTTNCPIFIKKNIHSYQFDFGTPTVQTIRIDNLLSFLCCKNGYS